MNPQRSQRKTGYLHGKRKKKTLTGQSRLNKPQLLNIQKSGSDPNRGGKKKT